MSLSPLVAYAGRADLIRIDAKRKFRFGRKAANSVPQSFRTGTGLRDGEACSLDWRDVNLASGTLRIDEAKTNAGVRRVDLPLAVREELSAHKPLRGPIDRGDPVFVNRCGRENVSNLGRRLKAVIRRANERLVAMGLEPIDPEVSPYSFRRLYASLRFALGDDPVYVAEQMGHEDGAFSMRVYARAVRRRERLTGTALREFDRALEWAEMGRIEPEPAVEREEEPARATLKTAPQSRNLRIGPDSSVG
jgi:integrase